MTLIGLCASSAATATAQEKPLRISLGYAYADLLESGAGSAPEGGYLSLAWATGKNGAELDLAYHRDSEKLLGQTFHLNTFTATIGPRVRIGDGRTQPYFHLLGGIRHDSFEGAGNTSFGAMAGTGADFPLTSSLFLRIGADFQLWIDDGDNLKVLRLVGGVSF
ncbi:MAG: outer membrane beta-barrel protein [Gemmatimonadota bacterium]